MIGLSKFKFRVREQSVTFLGGKHGVLLFLPERFAESIEVGRVATLPRSRSGLYRGVSESLAHIPQVMTTDWQALTRLHVQNRGADARTEMLRIEVTDRLRFQEGARISRLQLDQPR